MEGRPPEELLGVGREEDSEGSSDDMAMLRGASQEFVHLYAEDIGGMWDPLRPPKVRADLGLNPTRGGLSDLLAARLLAAGDGELEELSEASEGDVKLVAGASD